MNIDMFTSWQVRCGIASYAGHLVQALNALEDTSVTVTPFDKQAHPRQDYVAWGKRLNTGDVAHIQHEYAFFGYLLPWRNYYGSLVSQIQKPLVITRHVSFDGPLMVPGHGPAHRVRQLKWSLYNRWLGPYAIYLNKQTFDIAQQIIVLSQRLKDHLVARGVRDEKIHVIPAGIPSIQPASGGEEVRVEHAWQAPRKKVIGIFGYITPAKGHLIALDALAQLADDYVLLIGGGLRREADRPALDALNRRIDELHLQSRVAVTGYLQDADIPRHIDACDVLVYPATHVDSSYSVVEGLAYQHAPVIVSDVYGHRELAERHAGVEMFQSGNATALVQAIQRVTSQADLRARLMHEAQQYGRDFSWASIAQQTREVYALALEIAGHHDVH
jgi:glycosyltransferase involved in cell wall biosynthesis